MKSTPHLALGIVVLLLVIAGGAYVLFAPKAAAPSVSTASSQTNVTYLCQGGSSITATYTVASTSTAPSALSATQPGSVALVLSDGRSFTLPQVQSGSGIRYEKNVAIGQDVAFVSKGDNAMLIENGLTTYADCVANASAPSTTSTTAQGMNSFTDQGKTFTFNYPSTVTISGGEAGYTTDWMVNATTSGMLLAKGTLPKSFESGTNFDDATFTVGTSADPSAVAECLTWNIGNNGSQKQNVTINGVTYAKFVASDAGAGNLYQTTSYRTVRNNQCYAIEYTIHSSQLGNYPASMGIKAFDQNKVTAVFERMMQSFKFLTS